MKTRWVRRTARRHRKRAAKTGTRWEGAVYRTAAAKNTRPSDPGNHSREWLQAGGFWPVSVGTSPEERQWFMKAFERKREEP